MSPETNLARYISPVSYKVPEENWLQMSILNHFLPLITCWMHCRENIPTAEYTVCWYKVLCHLYMNGNRQIWIAVHACKWWNHIYTTLYKYTFNNIPCYMFTTDNQKRSQLLSYSNERRRWNMMYYTIHT
jgi:hypothetical protein